MLLEISRLDLVLAAAVNSGEPAALAKYAFQLAQGFSRFYHDYRVLDETDEARRNVLIWMTHHFAKQLEKTLNTLGIEVPEYM